VKINELGAKRPKGMGLGEWRAIRPTFFYFVLKRVKNLAVSKSKDNWSASRYRVFPGMI